MAKITRDEILKIAQLSSLHIEEKDLEIQMEKFNSILEAVDHLSQIDDKTLEGLQKNHPSQTPVREDVTKPCLSVEDVLKNSPSSQPPFFHIPDVIERS
ncbi:MAG: Asp-tRNA(Asn)/Glu-tRNA(Gln) amidotransferase subunit GatC [Bdellovibrionota bacterium]